MVRNRNVKLKRKQGGWVGLIVLLLALLIVGYLAKDALVQYGLGSGVTASKSRTPIGATAGASGAAMAAGVDASGVNIDSAAPAPTAPLDQARNMGATVQSQADEVAQRMNAAEK